MKIKHHSLNFRFSNKLIYETVFGYYIDIAFAEMKMVVSRVCTFYFSKMLTCLNF